MKQALLEWMAGELAAWIIVTIVIALLFLVAWVVLWKRDNTDDMD